MSIETAKSDAVKVLCAIKDYEYTELFIDEDGSGFIDLEGVTFYFDKSKAITKTEINL